MLSLFRNVTALVLACSAGLHAASNSAVFDINKGTYNDSLGKVTAAQFNPVAARNGDRALVVWQDAAPSNNPNKVWAALVTPAGKVLTPNPIIINDGTARAYSLPSVSECGDRFLVVWNDRRNLNTTGEDIYGRFVSKTGELSAEFLICSAPGDQYFPRVAWNGTHCLVTWAQFVSNFGSMCGRRVTTDGTLLDGVASDPRVFASAITQVVFSTALASDGVSWAIVWGENSAGVPANVYGIEVKADGTSPQQGTRGNRLAPFDRLPTGPDIAWNGSRYLVVFADWNFSTFNNSHNIYGQLLTPDLSADGGMLTFSTGKDLDFEPEVSAKAGDFLITWSSAEETATQGRKTRLKGLTLSSGTPGTPFVIMENTGLTDYTLIGDITAFDDRWLVVSHVYKGVPFLRAGARLIAGGRATPPLVLPTVGNRNLGDGSFDLLAEGLAGLGFTFESLTPGVVTVAGGRVTLVGAGEASIRVTLNGNAIFGTVSAVIRFRVGLPRQTVNIAGIDLAYPGVDAELTATASSGQTVTYSILEGPAAIIDDMGAKLLRITDTGRVVVRVSVAGNANFDAYTQDYVVGVDTTRPTVRILAPSGTLAAASTIVNGRAGDNNAVAAVFARINNEPWLPTILAADDREASWTLPFPFYSGLRPGTNRIEARALDFGGNFSEIASRTVQVNTTSDVPIVGFSNPSPNSSKLGLAAAVAEGTIATSGTASKVFIRLNGGEWHASTNGLGVGSWTISMLPKHGLKKGANILQLRGENEEGGRSIITTINFKFVPAPTDDFTAPVATITGPAPSLTGNSFAVTYTVDDNSATVEHRIDGGLWQPSPPSIMLTHDGRPMTVELRATDTNGNVSKLAKRIFTQIGNGVINALPYTSEVPGDQGGTITPTGLSTAKLGKKITLTAKPKPGFTFIGWRGDGVDSKSPKLTLTVPSNLEIGAYFQPELRPTDKRAYTGLALRADNDAQHAGLLAALLNKGGAFTAKLLWAGKPYNLKGTFDANGDWNGTIARKNLDPLEVTLRLDLTGTAGITGTIREGADIASLRAPRTTNYPTALHNPWDATYTLAIPAPASSNLVTAGSATLTIAANGTLKLKGNLADGTPIATGGAITDGDQLALGLPLGKVKGQWLLLLTLSSTDGDRGATGPSFHWNPTPTTGFTGSATATAVAQ